MCTEGNPLGDLGRAGEQNVLEPVGFLPQAVVVTSLLPGVTL